MTMMSEKVRVLIVDDHDMVRRGLQVLLENYDDIQVVGEANSGDAAVAQAHHQQPHVVLMDVIMPRMSGIDAIAPVRVAAPNAHIIMLTSFDNDQNVQDALKAGAVGYLLKNVTGDELAGAIRKAALGQGTLAPEAAQALIRAATRPPALGKDLTEREREVLSHMLGGLNNREIGEVLVISSSTVKNHVSSILSKLGTTSRTHAVALAIEHHIVEPQ
ncbi:MAG: response regulator transcription factor [Pleurocapsa minor GSE-CHR-MK-17-07R]|nr:response regulator transcription factor [Pleurocapsa minor GSE-CHR-MK 17-07R]